MLAVGSLGLTAAVVVVVVAFGATRSERGADVSTADAAGQTDNSPTATAAAVTTTTVAVAPAHAGSGVERCAVPTPGAAYPDPRFGSVLVATANGGFVIHGGRGEDFNDRSETWSTSCSGWQKLRLDRTPPPSEPGETVAVFDAARDETVLLTESGATWVWNGIEWSLRSDTGPRLVRPVGAHDAAHGEVVVFGGSGDYGEPSQTWVWNGLGWTRRETSIVPPDRLGGHLVFDSARGKAYLFGGARGEVGQAGSPNALSDTWTWDGTAWTELTPAHAYTPSLLAAAFDEERGVTVALGSGAERGSSETWLWDGIDWTPTEPVHNPLPRSFGAMAYVPMIGRVALFGGKAVLPPSDPGPTPRPEDSAIREEIVNDLWTWDGMDWTQVR